MSLSSKRIETKIYFSIPDTKVGIKEKIYLIYLIGFIGSKKRDRDAMEELD